MKRDMCLLILCGLVVCASAYASDPVASNRIRQSERALIEQFRGGDQTGYGISRQYDVTSTATSTQTTPVSSAGMYRVHYVNIGAKVIHIATNGDDVSATNIQVILPPGMAFADSTKVPVRNISYYTPVALDTSTLIITY
jgi:hypothetical protein